MANYSTNGGSWSSVGTNIVLYLDVTTTHIVGSGTQIDVSAYAKSSASNVYNPWGTGTRSMSIPGAVTGNWVTDGSSASASWGYSWNSNNSSSGTPLKSTTVAVYTFTRYVPYSYGTSTTVTINAAGNAPANSLGSESVSQSVTLFSQPVAAPTQTTAPTLSGTAVSGTSLTATAGTYTGAASVSTAIAYNTGGSFSGTSNVKTGNPYTVTTGDAAAPAYYFAAQDTVVGNNGTTYYYYSAAKLSSNPAPTPAPGVPSSLYSSGITGTGITLNWTAGSDAAGYDVYRDGSYVGSTTSTSYNFSGLANGTSYTLGVRSTNTSLGTAQQSSIASITATTLSAPAQPSSLSVSGYTLSSLTLNWGSVSGATGYNVYRNGTFLTNTTSTSYNFTGLANSTTYTLGVSAYNAVGTSSTASINATTLSATFTVPNVVGQSRSSATTNLSNAGFGTVTVNLVTAGATASNNNLVKTQTPLSGSTATTGDTATIDVYNYLVTMPNILGLSEAAANTALANAGFSLYSSSTTTSGATVSNNMLVGSQNPTGGSQANPANAVTFTVYNFLTSVPNVVGLKQDVAITSLTSSGFTSIVTTLTDVGVTPANAGTVQSQSPPNSGTTYNPKNQQVSLVVYSLGISGKRYSSTTNSMVSLTTSKRFDGTNWVQTTVAKRYDGTQWKDIVN